MKKRIRYTNGPIGDIRIVKDFLPSPAELVFKHKHKKVTINLNQSSVDFFKKVGESHHTPYQKVIRSVLDSYADHFAVS